MSTHRRVLVALLVIGLFLAAALPALAQDSGAADPGWAPVKVHGKVSELQGTAFAVRTLDGEVRIATNALTRLRISGVENPTLKDLQIGDQVDVAAVRKGDTLLARLVVVRPERVTLNGDVTQITGNNLKIQNPGGKVLVHTDEHTRFRVPGVENPTLADVHVGDLVGILAFGQEDGTILAKAVNVLRGIRFQGEVTGKEGSMLTVQTEKGPLEVLTDAETKYRVPGVENPTLEDVHVGDRVGVIAVSQGAGGGLLAKGVAVLPEEQGTP